MEILMTIILLLVCLVISNIISHYVPFLPTALTQIAIGVAIALIYKEFHLEIETEWFLLLFIAPLLYNDGRHFPRDELWKMRAPIFGNAIVLVLLTTIGGGWFIHWTIPDIPIAAAFALAAILSPTDPVAVNGIAKRIHLPESVLNLVRGESLINDASGLVAFNYAVAAVVTGYFSLREAIFEFTYMFLAGALLGLVLSLLMTWIRYSLRKKGISDVTLHSLLQLLTPFLIYIIAEEMFHASGVIAVVVGGIVHSLLREKAEPMQAEEQVLTENIWSTVSFILNGTVFLLLGLIIPPSVRSTVESPSIHNALAVGYVLAIGVAILAIRFGWTYLFSYFEHRLKRGTEVAKPTVKMTLLISFTGVRGALTMAGVLSIPFLLENGDAFPERSLILFLAAGVILFTLLAATLFLPLLSKSEASTGELSPYLDMNAAKSRLLIAAMKKVRSEINEENESAAYQLLDEFKQTFEQTNVDLSSKGKEDYVFVHKIREVRLMALKAERKYMENALQKGEVDEELFQFLMNAFDLREESLSHNARSQFSFLVRSVLRERKRSRRRRRESRKGRGRIAQRQAGRELLLKSSQAALNYLEANKHALGDAAVVYPVIFDYKRFVDRLKGPGQYNASVETQKEELRIVVMDVERSEIRRMHENGEISSEQAKELRRMVNYIENETLYEHAE
ncbi:Na+/H+ antiporter [Paenibacillus curdlanolyticus YK9]|uniref:Na+/H+ antiporter n=1 Tax=Paenibacillus curdlanolyticus YK9 TaxID=717606 RepID=E0I5M5_9BACL|nr:Na+/H+ antiporter [Paenibacillus curdlanolyticus]EFM12267.1 Na+/H+ antiporter [Paenibacillus curdlanolyticus YK9]